MAIHLTEQARQDVTIGKGTIYLDSDTGELNVAGRTTPHIIPGVLYPAVSGNDINGNALGGSYVYGTAHTDGRKYYYTDIKGSRPIHDPRVGSVFGSQRHKIKSLQLLEQETATQGNNVYSLDGRKWLRLNSHNNSILDFNRADGRCIGTGASGGVNSYFEIVGYFSDMNLLGFTQNSDRGFNVKVDGGTATAENNSLQPSVNSPLGTESNGRYVDAGAVVNLGLNQTLGIHTVRITPHASGDYVILYGVELIAQDTSNRNNIQIPSQNVVSYGKKFTVSGTPHYDPFNGFVNGTSLHSEFVDTATSLGLDTAPGSSAKWAISSTNHIRPYQGGRVVKWVDSDGTIKTSVNMIPPNAQNIGTTADSEITTPSATNTNYKPAFSDDAIDHSLSEVARTFHVREFGNGNANGGESGPYKDASMLWSTERDIAYVMDDGLSSFSASGVKGDGGIYRNDAATFHCHTFIGTGISLKLDWGGTNTDIVEIAQNLPYGTHILKHDANDSDSNTMDFTLDGVSLKTGHGLGNTPSYGEITYFQPKRPPIPEDACVLADYMLMADFVAIGASGNEKISKGVRFNSASRDFFADTSDSTLVLAQDIGLSFITGFKLYTNSSNANALTARLPSFGTNFVVRGYNIQQRK